MRESSRRVKLNIGQPRPHAHQAKSGIRPAVFYSIVTALLTTNGLLLVAFLMSGDIASLMAGQTDYIQTAYRDRIVELRQEVDRLHSRQYAQAGDLNLQLQELSIQQDVLTEQHHYIKALAAKASELGLETASVDDTSIDTTIVTGAISGQHYTDIEAVTFSVQQMMDESRLALTALSDAATQSTDKIVSELGRIGIKPRLPAMTNSAMGGPFVPAPGSQAEASMIDEANSVMAAFDRFKAARAAANKAPIFTPITSKARMSSNYGTRKDPFLNRSAFHSGIDFAATTGTIVRSAGSGKISFVGRKSGYGNVVEVEHSGGWITRYAHLSAFLVKTGQSVSAGSKIAKVGSTGRSTGPHLHFEVRRKDGPVNPSTFLKVGSRLSKLL